MLSPPLPTATSAPPPSPSPNFINQISALARSPYTLPYVFNSSTAYQNYDKSELAEVGALDDVDDYNLMARNFQRLHHFLVNAPRDDGSFTREGWYYMYQVVIDYTRQVVSILEDIRRERIETERYD